MKFNALVLAVLPLLLLLASCTEKRGLTGGEFVTFKQLRENPDKYMYKLISFKIMPDAITVSDGFDLADTVDREAVAQWDGMQCIDCEDCIERHKKGIKIPDIDFGKWTIYFDCKIPFDLAVYGQIDDTLLETQRLFKPKEYLKKGQKIPGTKRKFAHGNMLISVFWKKNVIYTGYLVKYKLYVGSDSLELETKRQTGLTAYEFRPEVFLTGVTIP